MTEIWKDVVGYEGLYQVSNCGRIKSLRKEVWNGHKFYIKEERVLRPTLNKDLGYYSISLSKNSTSKRFYVHRLVALAFISNDYNKIEVDHINTVRTDNRVENLRWSTKKENRNNPLSIEHLRIAVTGENSPHLGKKRTEETCKRISENVAKNCYQRGRTGSLCDKSKPIFQLDLDGNLIKRYAGQAEAFRETGIRQGDISRVCNGKRNIAGGYVWKFA